MSELNYDASQVGVPYVRVHRLTIEYPDAKSTPTAYAEQSLAVKLADGSVRTLETMQSLAIPLDFGNGDSLLPLVNPDTGAPLGANTSLNSAFLSVLAVVRDAQIKAQ